MRNTPKSYHSKHLVIQELDHFSL